jgi:hypothetical protein
LLAIADYSSNGPRLYDPYLMQDDGTLYPVPVLVTNRPLGGAGGVGQVRLGRGRPES